MTTITNEELGRAKQLIYSADLQSTINRLIKMEKWTPKHAHEACAQYRNYLYLKKKYPTFDLPPSRDIDEVWHAHILHTEAYTNFCEAVFGAYLHHHPHQGKDNSIAIEQLIHMFESQTQKLYLKEFGEYIVDIRSSSIFGRIFDYFRWRPVLD